MEADGQVEPSTVGKNIKREILEDDLGGTVDVSAAVGNLESFHIQHETQYDKIDANKTDGTEGGKADTNEHYDSDTDENLDVTVVNEIKMERKEISCNLCEKSFTRNSSLNRHIMGKHTPKVEDTRRVSSRAKRRSTVSIPYLFDEPKRKLINTKESQKKNLKILLSKKKPLKADESGDNLVFELSDKHSVLKDEQVLMQTIRASCRKLEEMGRHILVVAVDGEHSQWFGSSCGVDFAKDNMEVIGNFYQYCKDKESVEVEMHIGESASNGTDDDLQSDDNGGSIEDEDDNDDDNNHDDKLIINYNLEDVNAIMANDDNSNDDDNETVTNKTQNMVDDYNGNEEERDNKIVTKTKIKIKSTIFYKKYMESREKLLQEVTEELEAAEVSRDSGEVVRILKKRFGPGKPINFTVGDLSRGRYVCKACGYKFLWKCHLEVHQVKNPYCDRVTNYKLSDNDVLKENITFEHLKTGVQITTTFQELLDSQKVHPLECAICGKSQIRDRTMLSRHLVRHNKTKTFKCNICCAGFNGVGYISTHLKEHFRKSYECLNCHWKFKTVSRLKQHTENGCKVISLLNDTEEDASFETTLYICEICSVEATGISGLREHLSAVHEQQSEPSDCVLCGKQCGDINQYHRHLSLSHGPKKYKCPFCSKYFDEKSNKYLFHVKTHKAKEFPYVCDFCGEKFKDKRTFEPHWRLHTGERPFVCTFEGCNKTFRSKDSVLQHKWCHNTQHFICDFCGRKFKKPSLLNNHRLTHTVEWRYPCIYCSQKFHNLRPFKQHLARNHPHCVEEVKEKFKIILHACKMCPKVFYEKEDHITHMYRHKGIKPFACKFCVKTFSDKSNMTQHELIHSGGKRLKCNMCSRRFQEVKFLQAHIERLHKKSLSNESTSTHELTHSGGSEGLKCIMCSQTFEEEPFLRAHIEAFHMPYQHDLGGEAQFAGTGPMKDEDIDELRESTLQIIEETIRRNDTYDNP